MAIVTGVAAVVVLLALRPPFVMNPAKDGGEDNYDHVRVAIGGAVAGIGMYAWDTVAQHDKR